MGTAIESVGEAIKRMRQEKKIPRRELAQAAGLTEGALYRLEAGQRRLYLDVAGEIAAALGCLVDDFLPRAELRPSTVLIEDAAKKLLRGRPRPLKNKPIPQLRKMLRDADARTVAVVGSEILARLVGTAELYELSGELQRQTSQLHEQPEAKPDALAAAE
jgi:transcriptional regulator with XRE-family HTH domain